MAGHTDKKWPILTKQIEIGDTIEFNWPDPLMGGKATGTVLESNGEWIKVHWVTSNSPDKPQGVSIGVKIGFLIGSPYWDIYDSKGVSYKDFRDYPKQQ